MTPLLYRLTHLTDMGLEQDSVCKTPWSSVTALPTQCFSVVYECSWVFHVPHEFVM